MPRPERDPEKERRHMARMAADPRHRRGFERLLHLACWKGDPEQVAERLSWQIDPDCRSKKSQRTPLIRAITGNDPLASVVELLLKAGADPSLSDIHGKSALDYARARLARYEGKPRKPPRRSPSLTPHGDIRLRPAEHAFLDRIRRDHPEDADEYEAMYLAERRKAAERTFDVRGNLEKIVPMLERATIS